MPLMAHEDLSDDLSDGLSTAQDTDLTVYCAGFLPCTAFWTTAVVWLILASLLPLFFLNYV